MLKFVIYGVAGYVAPRHLRAIKDCGGTVVGACDPFDSVGLLDSYNKECEYFKNQKDFERFCMMEQPDYTVICTPNYLHYDQCLVGLRTRSDVICEKPIVLTGDDLKRLRNVELETEHRVYTILQCRLKPELIELKEKITEGHKVFLRYHTPRGRWYKNTWKNGVRTSGGLATNIGVHMFDILLWLFGTTFSKLTLIEKTEDRVVGSFETPRASIEFDLSIEPANGVRRQLFVDDICIDFTENFTNLHTESYKKILTGDGFGLDDAEPSVTICEKIRKTSVG